jgi:glycosyltransferase involved in cell wall biosynthesis
MTIKTNDRKLTVLHVATLNQPVRPDLGYGPIETIVYSIDKGLHAAGHRSIVACSGDSRVAGEHCVTVERSFGGYWSDDTREQRAATHAHYSRTLRRLRQGDIDVIHTHDPKAVAFLYDGARGMRVPIVMTLHVSAKESRLGEEYRRWCDPLLTPQVHSASISEYQKRQYRDQLQTSQVVYHGIDVEDYPCKDAPAAGGYLFTIGRVTRDKGQEQAIALAKRTGAKLIIAGCVQNKPADRAYFAGLRHSLDLTVDVGALPVGDDYYARVIRPLVDSNRQIIYIGEINSEQKKQWYLHALATVFPIQWGEPFGLVLVESMACGTPVIAFDKGAVPEIVAHGTTGFVVDSLPAMIAASGRIDRIDPHACRGHVRDRFSLAAMARNYAELYHQILAGPRTASRTSRPSAGVPPGPRLHERIATIRNHA